MGDEYVEEAGVVRSKDTRMEYFSSMLTGGPSVPKYVAPSPRDDVVLSHGVERSPNGPGCEIVYDVTIGGRQRCRRRYAHFRALHVSLKKSQKSSFSGQLPECAPSRTMQELARGRSGEATDRIIKQRTTRLQVYLKSVVSSCATSVALRSFLDVNVGAWDDPAGWDEASLAAALATAEAEEEDSRIEDPEVAASVREQRAILARAREELEVCVSERQALDAASEDGHDQNMVAVTLLASELSAAKDAVTCAVKHKERLEQLKTVEADRANRATRRDRRKLVEAVATARKDDVEGIERRRADELAEAAEGKNLEAEAVAASRDVEAFRVEKWAPARARAAEATERAEASEIAATAAERRLAEVERREAEIVAASAALREAADAAHAQSEIAEATLRNAITDGEATTTAAYLEAASTAALCEERSTAARKSLAELRLLERLRRAHDASRREMVGAAVTREAARLRDGPLKLYTSRVREADSEFRDERAKAALATAVMAAEAIFGSRGDALRSASKRIQEKWLLRDKTRAEERAAELAATTATAASAELVAAATWAREHAAATREDADAAAVERDEATAAASELEAQARTAHASREEEIGMLGRLALQARVEADEADFAVSTRDLLLKAGPVFSELSKDTARGIYPDTDEDEPLFPQELVDRLRVFNDVEDEQFSSLDENDDFASSSFDDADDAFDSEDVDAAIAKANALVAECEADRDKLAEDHAAATVKVNEERAAIDAKIKSAKEKVASTERAIARLTAYSAAPKKTAAEVENKEEATAAPSSQREDSEGEEDNGASDEQ